MALRADPGVTTVNARRRARSASVSESLAKEGSKSLDWAHRCQLATWLLVSVSVRDQFPERSVRPAFAVIVIDMFLRLPWLAEAMVSDKIDTDIRPMVAF